MYFIIFYLCACVCVFACVSAHDDARQSTVGVEFSIETHGLIDKVLVGINYIVLTRLGKKKKKKKRKKKNVLHGLSAHS